MHLAIKNKIIVIFLCIAVLFVFLFLNMSRNVFEKKNDIWDGFHARIDKISIANSWVAESNTATERLTSSDTEAIQQKVTKNTEYLIPPKDSGNIKLLNFEVLNELPNDYRAYIQKNLDMIIETNKLGNANHRITGRYHQYLVEEEPDLDLRERVFNALMYHVLLSCRQGSGCRTSAALTTVPASRISNADQLAWIKFYNLMKPLNQSAVNTELDLINKLRLDENDLADYKFNNIIYYINDKEYSFHTFIEDYWTTL